VKAERAAARFSPRGANPNGQIDSSGSPVNAAFSHERWELVELLRSRGGLASVATRGAGVQMGHGMIVEMLRQHGGAR